jgi:hypothetical protein
MKGIQMKNKRQVKAEKVIMICSRRMISKVLGIDPKQINDNVLFNDEGACAMIRELYQINQKQPDRLTRAYDLADLVR